MDLFSYAASLTNLEGARLVQLELVIEIGLKTFVDVGTALLEIRDNKLYRLNFSTFEDYCRERWGMSHRHANRMIEAAGINTNLGPIGPKLPETESQARELASLEPEQQRQVWARVIEQAKDDKITARLIQNIAKELRQESLNKHREERIEKLAKISMGNKPIEGIGLFPIVYADPPWRYENPPMGGSNRSVENHYPTMELEEICALPIKDIITEDAILYLWATAPKLAECMKVIEYWGFEYRTNFVWVKDKIGMGYHARNQHELLLVARCGNIPPPRAEDRVSSVVYAERTDHSKKPEIFYELIESFYPELKKVELFARQARKGWTIWGNECD